MRMTQKQLVEMEAAGTARLARKSVAKKPAVASPPPPSPDPKIVVVQDKDAGRAYQAAAAEMGKLTKSLIEALHQSKAMHNVPRPVAYEFDIERDSRGFMSKIVVTPIVSTH